MKGPRSTKEEEVLSQPQGRRVQQRSQQAQSNKGVSKRMKNTTNNRSMSAIEWVNWAYYDARVPLHQRQYRVLAAIAYRLLGSEDGEYDISRVARESRLLQVRYARKVLSSLVRSPGHGWPPVLLELDDDYVRLNRHGIENHFKKRNKAAKLRKEAANLMREAREVTR